jgi:hypothetical protein
MRIARFLSACLLLVSGSIATFGAGCEASRSATSVTKPMSPADGAKDYDVDPGGPSQRPPGPNGGKAEPEATRVDCPPTCDKDTGMWEGCGLLKPTGGKCQGCEPRCRGKGTESEGWYDCSGVQIVARRCGG